MPRRAGAQVPVSFFSFQDVLLSLIGITIVITMILLIQVTKVTADAVRGARVSIDAGIPLTERSVNDSGVLPEVIHLFREGIVDEAGGWDEDEDDDGPFGGEEAVRREIRITLLHEIGHHFGLDEDDLERLGYG